MNNHGLTVENLMQTFPAVLKKDRKIVALGTAVARVLIKRNAEINALLIYPNIDNLPEDLLDILAYDFKVDWWDPNYSLEEKRATLKSSWSVHKMLGTKAAVETALSAIYPNTKVVEWFEYGGEPYHFKLQINATYEEINTEKHSRVMNRLAFYKRHSAILDAVEYCDDCAAEAYSATAHAGTEIIDGAVAMRY